MSRKTNSIKVVLVLFLTFCLSLAAAENLWKGSKLAGTGQEPLPYKAVPIFNDIRWQQPIAMTPVPQSPGQYILIERYGNIWHLQKDGSRSLLMKMATNLINGVFHPEFPKKPYFYLRYSTKGKNRLKRYTVTAGTALVVDLKTEKVILEWHTVGHRGGDLAFGPDGLLYIATGDARKPGDPDNTGQKTDNLRGSILRIDVNTDAKVPYLVPKDNPFVGMKNVRPEVWSYGLRNPWRFTFKPGTNELWIGDNGDESWEMISRATKGSNHGWSVYEGNHLFRPGNKLEGPTLAHSPAIVEHSHREMRSVIGGRWYQGKQFPELKGQYVYGAHMMGKLWSFSYNGSSVSRPRKIADIGGLIVSFCEAPDGELYVITLNRGIFKLVRAPKKEFSPIPQLLSQTGIFSSTEKHLPAPGMTPYKVNLPMYKDGSLTERYIGIPSGQQIKIKYSHKKMSLLPPQRNRSGLDRWALPAGSTIAQTFYFLDKKGNKKRVETQLSLNDDNEWRFLTYKWNDAQTDAELVSDGGESKEVQISTGEKINWRFPSRAECSSCHTHLTVFVPGIHISQLNRQVDYRGQHRNQLVKFKEMGYLPKNFTIPKNDFVMTKPSDEKASLEERARDYLHVNCTHCHRETGMGGRATFQLLSWMKTDGLNLINKKPLVGLPGVAVEKIHLLTPGKPEYSDLYRRMTTNAGKMPLFGSSTIDKEGVELIRKWIKSMKK